VLFPHCSVGSIVRQHLSSVSDHANICFCCLKVRRGSCRGWHTEWTIISLAVDGAAAEKNGLLCGIQLYVKNFSCQISRYASHSPCPSRVHRVATLWGMRHLLLACNRQQHAVGLPRDVWRRRHGKRIQMRPRRGRRRCGRWRSSAHIVPSQCHDQSLRCPSTR
jgi:hypothetical protein